MALKGDRVILDTDITHTCESVAERGVTLCTYTSGSGIALGDSAGKGDLLASASGAKVLGILLQDVVSIDETQYHRNFHKVVQKTGEKVCILRKGWVVTDKITGTPAVGGTAYLTSNGVLTPTKSATGGVVATPVVGEFRSIKDENGFVKVEVNLPFMIA